MKGKCDDIESVNDRENKLNRNETGIETKSNESGNEMEANRRQTTGIKVRMQFKWKQYRFFFIS